MAQVNYLTIAECFLWTTNTLVLLPTEKHPALLVNCRIIFSFAVALKTQVLKKESLHLVIPLENWFHQTGIRPPTCQTVCPIRARIFWRRTCVRQTRRTVWGGPSYLQGDRKSPESTVTKSCRKIGSALDITFWH